MAAYLVALQGVFGDDQLLLVDGVGGDGEGWTARLPVRRYMGKCCLCLAWFGLVVSLFYVVAFVFVLFGSVWRYCLVLSVE